MSLTREKIQDGIVDPGERNSILKPYVMSHGTLECHNLKESRKFYEEFLGFECVRHALPAMVIRCGLKFHIVCVEVGDKVHPVSLLNHWGIDMESKEKVDESYEKALKYKDRVQDQAGPEARVAARRVLLLHGGPRPQLVGSPVRAGLPARRSLRLRRPLLDGRQRQDRGPEGTERQEQRLMASVFPSFLEELEARTAIEDCLKRFARAVDRQDWNAARELYHPDAFDDHGFFKGPPDAFLAHIEKMHAEQDHSMHFNTNVLIDFASPERAFVETYVLVLQRFRAEAPKVPAGAAGLRNLASARYLDRFEKRSGEWRVVHRTLVFGDVESAPMQEPLRFPPEFTVQRHDMDDPLYLLNRK